MSDKIGKISYPISNDYRFKEFWDKNIDLYGITGWFAYDYGASQFTDQATAFGGYLKFKKDDGSFDGEIVDMWGRARVAGVLSDTNLYFNKIYVEKALIGTFSTLIHYYFSKSRKGIWLGSFVLTTLHPDIIGKDLLEITAQDVKLNIIPFWGGRSNCKVYPVCKNAYGIIGGPIRYE